ncbi:MAG TPA: hypothetical protein VFQ91_24915 [Bryobacteraceae bacterium]|nr:hypothetical protein [Bryobacteraceae bacterium]
MRTRRHALLALGAVACGRKPDTMNALAERYVKLILGIGHHDANYVDAYYGPEAWRPAKRTLQELATEASALADAILGRTGEDSYRQNYLLVQTRAAGDRLRMLQGEKFSFDQESKLLYEVEPPAISFAALEAGREAIDKALPGSGPLEDRFSRFEARFAIPPSRVDRTFKAAIAEARSRTRQRIPGLPSTESFDVEYVAGKSWSAYNWYKGKAHSLIQVNSELPIGIDRILHLACHEGYPGHHVYNTLLENRLVDGKGWSEYSVYPLYSPQSLIAEGTADYGSDLVIHGEDRLAFKRDVLFKEAGLDPKLAAEQHQMQQWTRALRHAPIQAARAYLDGTKTAEETVAYLRRYGLQSKGMAERRLRFFDEHRSYIINYSFGEDLVAAWVARTAGNAEDARWKSFVELLSNPRTPANLL